MNKDGHRIIAPEAHHGGQCEGGDWVWRKKKSSHPCALKEYQTHTHTFLFSTWLEIVTESLRQRRTTEDSVSVEIECEE